MVNALNNLLLSNLFYFSNEAAAILCSVTIPNLLDVLSNVGYHLERSLLLLICPHLFPLRDVDFLNLYAPFTLLVCIVI